MKPLVHLFAPGLLVACLYGLAPVGASASTYEAEVRAWSSATGTCGNPLDSDSGPSASASASIAYVAGNGGTGSGQGDTFGAAGEIGGRLQLSVANNASTSGTNSHRACMAAKMTIDDIMVTGPGTEVTTRLFVDVSGVVTEFIDTPAFESALANGVVQIRLLGTHPSGSGQISTPYVSFPFNASVNTTLSTAYITVNIGYPLTAEVRIGVTGSVEATRWGDLHSAGIDIDFSDSVSFPLGGPVLDLPAGYTADSATGSIVDNARVEVTTSVDQTPGQSYGYALHNNAPNPFNPATTIRYELGQPGVVRLTVYDVAGRRIDELVEGEHQSAGPHAVVWEGRDLRGKPVASGVYFYRLQTGTFAATRRMVLLK